MYDLSLQCSVNLEENFIDFQCVLLFQRHGALCTLYGSMSLHLQFYNRSFFTTCLPECVCLAERTCVCISVSGNDGRV